MVIFDILMIRIHVQERVKNTRFGRDKTRLQNLVQLDDQLNQGDQARDKIRHRVRQMLSDSPTEGLNMKGK